MDSLLHYGGFVDTQIEVNQHFLANERERERSQENETAGSNA